MDIGQRKKYLIEKLKNEEYRKAYVSEHIDTGIPFQIKALRKQRNWTQKELAERIDRKLGKQESISRLEDPNYSKFTLTTLKKLASAFDVGLIVRFAPISELVIWELVLTPESLEVASFDQDYYFQESIEDASSVLFNSAVLSYATETYTEGLSMTISASDNIITPKEDTSNQAFVPLNDLMANAA